MRLVDLQRRIITASLHSSENVHGINDCYNFSTKKGKEYFQQNSFFPTSTFHVCLFFLNKVVDIEKGTISQVDPLGGRNSDFFYVVQYDVLKIQSLIVKHHFTFCSRQKSTFCYTVFLQERSQVFPFFLHGVLCIT